MKKNIMIVITFLLLIYAYFPKTFMGRMYVKDFEKRCFEPHFYDAVVYHMFKYGDCAEWEDASNIDWYREELEGTVICVSTSYDIDCFFYEDVVNDGVLWCTVNGYVQGSVIVGEYREYGTLTDIEKKAKYEAIQTFNRQVHRNVRKMIDNMLQICNYVTIVLVFVWGLYFFYMCISKKIKKSDMEGLESDFEEKT